MTPADVPANYNVFPDVWNDGLGYEPVVIGQEPTPDGRVMILISLSPGHTISATLNTGGKDQVEAAIQAIKRLASAGRSPLPAGPESPPRGPSAPVQGT